MNRWYALCDKFAVLTEREKWLIAISGWVALIFAGYLLVVEPVLMKQESLQRQRASISNVLTASMDQIQVIERKLRTDPDQEIDEEIARLTRENRALDDELGERVASLVSPVQMSALMEQVLQRTKQLQLVALTSQPPVQLISGNDQGYYIHPVSLTLRGRYFDVVAYLQQLEALPVKYYWRSLNYQVDTYPWADIQLDVYTLGESKDFIGG